MHVGFDFLLFFHTALVPFLAVRDLVLLWYIELQDRGAGLFWLLMLFYWWFFVCLFVFLLVEVKISVCLRVAGKCFLKEVSL